MKNFLVFIKESWVQLVDGNNRGEQDKFMLQLLIRQCAKEVFKWTLRKISQRLRKAMLRKAVTMRGPYRPGDLVCFSKKEKWYGPARVVSNEGTSSLWLVHRNHGAHCGDVLPTSFFRRDFEEAIFRAEAESRKKEADHLRWRRR